MESNKIQGLPALEPLKVNVKKMVKKHRKAPFKYKAFLEIVEKQDSKEIRKDWIQYANGKMNFTDLLDKHLDEKG